MMPCGIMHTTSLFCGDMASWEQVTAVLYQAVVCGKLDRHFQVKMDNTLGSKLKIIQTHYKVTHDSFQTTLVSEI